MSAAPGPTNDGFTMIGRPPVQANLVLIVILSGILGGVLGWITGSVIDGIFDIARTALIVIPVFFVITAGICLSYLRTAFRPVGVDVGRGTALLRGETIPLRSIVSGELLTRNPAATTPALSLRLTTDTGARARIIVNGGWLRSLPTSDLVPLVALIAGSGIPDDTGQDPLDVGRERISRSLAGKGSDVMIGRRGFIADCIAATESTGDVKLLEAVVQAAGPLGRSIRDEAMRAAQGAVEDVVRAHQDIAPAAPEASNPTPLVPPAPQYGSVVADEDEATAVDDDDTDDDRFRRPDDPARLAAEQIGDRVHLDKLGDRNGALGNRDTERANRDAERGDGDLERVDRDAERVGPDDGRELPSWIPPQDRARVRSWLADDDEVVHLQPIPETVGARTLRKVCDRILIGLAGIGLLAIFGAAIAEGVIDSLLPSDANALVAVAVVGSALLAFVAWIVGGIARAREIHVAQRFSLEWLERRGPEQRRRGLPPVLLQHFLGPIPASRLFAAGAYFGTCVGGVGVLAGALLSIDPEELGATGPIMLGVSLVLTAVGTVLFVVRWRRVKRQRALAIELGGERLAYLGNL
ncbi:hypothetical protein HOW07_16970 [Plantibacter sp. MCCC 1A11337]|uniref:hypothetical protein n=1 Tax=Plantibacter sp. MCCC 1A11337 TaxID=2736644 RepID=UPI0015828CD5|nr:hypothetical protein [Plantibacter sp. MCCC 1A11337]NUJ89709.1 hypothetical protein [Plantibacter sp. MCCC 1A11337]